MTNELTLTGQGPNVLAARRSTVAQAARQGISSGGFASVGYKGKVWSIKYKGEEELLRDERKRPLQDLEVVIVAASQYVSKSFYLEGFQEGNQGKAPDCWSINGIEPDPSAQNKQNDLCASCPKNAWGSEITGSGKKSKACSDRKRIVVVPWGDITNETYGGPMLLDLPPTSHQNLATYAAMLDRKGACIEGVATRLSFDPEVAYPKIVFEAIGWLSNEQAIEVVGPQGKSGMQAHPVIERMLNEVGQPEAEEDEPSPLDTPPPAAIQRRLAVVQSDEPEEDDDKSPAETLEEAPVVTPPPPAPEQPAAVAPPRRARGLSQQAPADMVAGAPEPRKPAPVLVREAPEDMAAEIERMLNVTA